MSVRKIFYTITFTTKFVDLGKAVGERLLLNIEHDFGERFCQVGTSGELSTIISLKDSQARVSYTIDSICHAPKVEARTSAA